MKPTTRISGGNNVAAKLKQLRERMSKERVVVGLPASSGMTEDGSLTIVQLGAIHEFGAGHNPERSFLRIPLRAAQDELAVIFKRLMPKVAAGELTMEQALNQIGAKAASISQEAIAAGIDPPNADSTKARKKSSTPLIDTGNLRQSITWVVRRPDK